MPIFKVAYMIFDALKTQLAVNLFIDTLLNLKKFLFLMEISRRNNLLNHY